MRAAMGLEPLRREAKIQLDKHGDSGGTATIPTATVSLSRGLPLNPVSKWLLTTVGAAPLVCTEIKALFERNMTERDDGQESERIEGLGYKPAWDHSIKVRSKSHSGLDRPNA